jgi:hypothetical protein
MKNKHYWHPSRNFFDRCVPRIARVVQCTAAATLCFGANVRSAAIRHVIDHVSPEDSPAPTKPTETITGVDGQKTVVDQV